MVPGLLRTINERIAQNLSANLPDLDVPTVFERKKRTLEIREKTALSFIRNFFGSPVRDAKGGMA